MLGTSRRSRWTELTHGSIINRVVRDVRKGIDVHVISPRDDGAEAGHGRSRGVPVRVAHPAAAARRRVRRSGGGLVVVAALVAYSRRSSRTIPAP